jgi:hypothetical protein
MFTLCIIDSRSLLRARFVDFCESVDERGGWHGSWCFVWTPWSHFLCSFSRGLSRRYVSAQHLRRKIPALQLCRIIFIRNRRIHRQLSKLNERITNKTTPFREAPPRGLSGGTTQVRGLQRNRRKQYQRRRMRMWPVLQRPRSCGPRRHNRKRHQQLCRWHTPR